MAGIRNEVKPQWKSSEHFRGTTIDRASQMSSLIRSGHHWVRLFGSGCRRWCAKALFGEDFPGLFRSKVIKKSLGPRFVSALEDHGGILNRAVPGFVGGRDHSHLIS